jgi:site-specific DNA recombinase
VHSAGARLIFCTLDVGDLNGSPEAHMAFGVTGVFAEYERLKIRERTTQGSRRRALQGLQPKRSMRPYGYVIVTKAHIMRAEFRQEQEGLYVVHDVEANFVNEIFDRYESGDSLSQIARSLCVREVPSPRKGRYWYVSTLSNIISNPVYKGEAVHGRFHRRPRRRENDGAEKAACVRERPAEEWVTIPAPRLVSVAQWEKCNRLLRENQQRMSGNPQRRYRLSGVLKCPLCGDKMYGSNRTSLGLAPRYRCRKGQAIVLADRCSFTVEAPWVETAVSQEILRFIQTPGLLEAYYNERRSSKDFKGTAEITKSLQGQLREMKKREDAIAEAQIRAVMAGADTGVYDRKMSELAEARRSVERDLEKLKPQEAGKKTSPKRASSLVSQLLTKAYAVLESSDAEIAPVTKHALLMQIIEKVEVDAERTGVKVFFAEPLIKNSA